MVTICQLTISTNESWIYRYLKYIDTLPKPKLVLDLEQKSIKEEGNGKKEASRKTRNSSLKHSINA